MARKLDFEFYIDRVLAGSQLTKRNIYSQIDKLKVRSFDYKY